MKKISDRICFVSIDVESDFGQKSFKGVEGLENILDIFKKYNISSTLFITGPVLEKYPDLVKKWSQTNEISCHNFTHATLDKLTLYQREKELNDFLKIYSSLFGQNPLGFRAPRFVIDGTQLELLEKHNFFYDSSVLSNYIPFKEYQGFKGKAPNTPYFPSRENYLKKGEMKILEIPIATQILGLPLFGIGLRYLPAIFWKILFKIHSPSFITLGMHSWDAVPFSGKKSFNSGEKFLKNLEELLFFLRKLNYRFLNGKEILNEFKI